MNAIQMLMMNSGNRGYGLLYNRHAIADSRFSPNNLFWGIPTSTQLSALKAAVINDAGHLKEAGTDHWLSPNTGADNSSSFSMYGSGSRSTALGDFQFFKLYAYIWSITRGSSTTNTYMQLGYNNTFIGIKTNGDDQDGFAVRFIYNGPLPYSLGSTITDYDGNVYNVIQIGTDYWLQQNWKCKNLNNGTPIPNVTDNTTWSNLPTLGRCAYDNDKGNA